MSFFEIRAFLSLCTLTKNPTTTKCINSGPKPGSGPTEKTHSKPGRLSGLRYSSLQRTSIRGEDSNMRALVNACFFLRIGIGIGIPLIYRFRATSVGTGLHEILILEPALAPVLDSGTRPPPADVITLKVEKSCATVDDFPLGFVLALDTPAIIVWLNSRSACLIQGNIDTCRRNGHSIKPLNGQYLTGTVIPRFGDTLFFCSTPHFLAMLTSRLTNVQ